MRLLDAWLLIHKGVAELVNFPDERSAPPYAILSHTWEDEEVLFEEIPLGPSHEIVTSRASLRASRWQESSSSEVPGSSMPHVKAGWNKILNTCLRACQDSLEYVWIDTCCIDKSSSAELSEAINSMYLWYKESALCYVLLSDCELCPDFDRLTKTPNFDNLETMWDWRVAIGLKAKVIPDLPALNDCMRNQLRRCKWFTRGWTLQELLAPSTQIFFDKRWQWISNKRGIQQTLASITGIPQEALASGQTSQYTVAQRMFWASKRNTTRIEDEAYSLLGIFGISLPLIYGEGTRAFLRLQEEIIKISQDQSIFAWELRPGIDGEDCFHCLFAPSVANFWWHASSITQRPFAPQSARGFQLTNRGVELQLRLEPYRSQGDFGVRIACLEECHIEYEGELKGVVGLRLRNEDPYYNPLRTPPESGMYTQVEVELVSTIEEPVPTYRRLAYIGADYVYRRDDWHERQLFVLRNGDFCFENHKQLLSSFGTVEIELRLRRLPLDQKAWRVIAAHPPTQWHARDWKMTLAFSRKSSFGCIVIENREQIRFIILIGLIDELRGSSGWKSRTPKCDNFQYWIFPASLDEWARTVNDCPSSVTLSRSRSSIPTDYEDPFALHSLCEQAKSFAHKDFFENSTRRIDCCKFAHLPNGDILRVQIEDVFDGKGIHNYGTPRTGRATYRLVVESNFAQEDNYLRDGEIENSSESESEGYTIDEGEGFREQPR